MLLREIQSQGYPGGISQLKAYLAPLKRQPEEPLIRFETAPAQQMQVDFTIIRRGRYPLKAFVATLGYSRASFVQFSDRENSAAWLDGLRAAFAYFGGVTEQVLPDYVSRHIMMVMLPPSLCSVALGIPQMTGR